MGGDREENQEEGEERDINRLLLGIMEGYSDSVIPPLSQLSPHLRETPAIVGEKAGSSSRKRNRVPEENGKTVPEENGKTEGLQKERDRRERMSEKFSLLQTIVPNLFPKATRVKIVSETIEYIEKLEKEKKRLEELKDLSEKMEPARGTITHTVNWDSLVTVDFSGDVVFFGIRTPARRSMAVKILEVFERHRTEVLAASVTVAGKYLTLAVTAFVKGDRGDTTEKIKSDILML
ncbi:transcription factor bHLH13-like [Malania oleifera]|uniref:transcription factor bHLH13-like n=1 Tax=Malania oleifera TaxID=397392 RepID=UPI0025ADB5D9|nr:transcription factor bHLH13-like [Malania oleifera]